ncbi:nucleoside deaminase [Candidatus Phytoplasma melaleucae]|uniref:Nucleoside deaminase n=1 Tax=Candidatus Phytoplasma melaleucae TaxID=2982630 RepID=A0ABT9DD61_9MOLU|nr:nucleoside deaminase ['Melaleuca sp.' phytoplasma]MDO8168014.1 nucleoside deaminase ['Melaleuca sp.' phytoplasma]
MDEKHFFFMEVAFKEAQKAFTKNEVPVGAVAVSNNKIISKAHNNTEKSQFFFGHAEFLVLMKINKKLKTYRMNDISIYITLEPCIMCIGALIQSRIQKVYYSVSSTKFLFTRNFFLFVHKKFYHHKFIKLGLFENENQKILKSFFDNLRKK